MLSSPPKDAARSPAPPLLVSLLPVLLAAAAILPAGPALAAESPVVLQHQIGVTVLATSCGPAVTEPFAIPDDAVVTAANFSVTPDLVTTPLLNARIDVRAGATLVASNTLTTAPLLLGVAGSLDVAAINAHLLNQSSVNGSVTLALEASVCPSTGAASVRFDYAAVTYMRTAAIGAGNGSGNGSAAAAIVGISIGGQATTQVEALQPLTVAPVVNGTLGEGFNFAWFVDGELVGNGPSLGNVTLTPGEHNITLRASNGTSVQTTTLHVTAAARIAAVRM